MAKENFEPQLRGLKGKTRNIEDKLRELKNQETPKEGSLKEQKPSEEVQDLDISELFAEDIFEGSHPHPGYKKIKLVRAQKPEEKEVEELKRLADKYILFDFEREPRSKNEDLDLFDHYLIYVRIEKIHEAYAKLCNEYEKELISISFITSKPEVISKYGEKTSEAKNKAEEYRQRYIGIRKELDKVLEDIKTFDDYASNPGGDVWIDSIPYLKTHVEKGNQTLEILKKFQETSSETEGWIRSFAEQDWNIVFNQENMNLHQFLDKLEEYSLK